MNTITRIGSLILSVSFAGAALAQAPAQAPSQGAGASVEFNTVDQNKDGRVSSAEAQAHPELQAAFSTLDADRDSYLSQAEFSRWNKAAKSGDAAAAPGQRAQSVTEQESQSEAQSQSDAPADDTAE